MSTVHAPSFDASYYPAAVTREVPGLGECRVDDLMMDEAMRLFAVACPLRLDYRRWASDFLATTLGEPRLSLQEVEDLSDLAREALRAASAAAARSASAYRSLAGSYLSRDERLFAAYYSTLRGQFESLMSSATDIAAQATAGLARTAIPVVRPLVLASVDGVARTTQSLARAASRTLTRPLERLSRPAVWVPPRVQIPSRSLETSVAAMLRRQLDNVARIEITLSASNETPTRREAPNGRVRGGSRTVKSAEWVTQQAACAP